MGDTLKIATIGLAFGYAIGMGQVFIACLLGIFIVADIAGRSE